MAGGCQLIDAIADRVAEITDAHGWDVIDKLTPSELIKAVADLGPAFEGEPGPAPSKTHPRQSRQPVKEQ